MTLGVIMLCHTALDRAAQIARYFAEYGAPVFIHIDKRTPSKEVDSMRKSLNDLSNVRFSPRYSCEWGTWGIVAATQKSAEMLLAEFPDVRHVFLASGSCLPLRPIDELRDYLDANPDTDYIESVTTADVGWTVGGLNIERFTLRFPFSWRKNRRLFDRYVKLQRRFGISRKLPEGLQPHLGSQWWCLTRQTLQAILQSPERARYDKYFRKVWIPDESYFQSLARLYARNVESRSLTLAKFDHQGKPHVFYDDHLQLLRRSDCFMARKIWPQANKLYKVFLNPSRIAMHKAEPNPGKIDRLFSKSADRRSNGRSGLYMQSRFPSRDWQANQTASQYSVFEGFSDLFEDFDQWLRKQTNIRVHGHLFDPEKVKFFNGEDFFNGALTDSATLRDYNPQSFLTNLIWNTRGERQCFQFCPRDNQAITDFIASDPNAHIAMITGAFAIPLFLSKRPVSELRSEAAKLQRIETEFLTKLRSPWVKARVRIWNLAEFCEMPMEHLQTLLFEVSPRTNRRLTEVPKMVDLTGFPLFLQQLRNQGMQPILMGDFQSVATDTSKGQGVRPYIVN